MKKEIQGQIQKFANNAELFKAYKGYMFMTSKSFGEAVRGLSTYGDNEAEIVAQLKGEHSQYRSIIVFVDDSKTYFTSVQRV